MPTLNPRVNVTLSPSLDALVTELSGLERVSKSMVLRELLEACEPSLRHAVALMKAAQGASAKAREKIAIDMEQTVKASQALSHLAFELAASNTRDMVAEAEAIRGRRPARGGGVATPSGGTTVSAAVARKHVPRPPSSNRGVKS